MSVAIAAAFVDIVEQMVSRTPLFFLFVVGLSFLLLSIVFRSIVIALKAAIMNLLSISAAFGVVVAIFQWGWRSRFDRRGQRTANSRLHAHVPLLDPVRALDGL